MYAKYDLIFTRQNSYAFAVNIKNINPDAIILPARDFNGAMGLKDIPDEWYVRNSKGELIMTYGGSVALCDITNFCPRADYNSYLNLRYNEFVGRYMRNLADFSVYDGVATDGFWDTPWANAAQEDIDLDRNGVNDITEHGWPWVVSQYKTGAMALATNLRNEMGPDKIILINGTTVDANRNLINGHVFEYGGSIASNWYSGYGFYKNLMYDNPLRSPQTICIDACNSWLTTATEATNVRNNFYLMRFTLATTMLGNGYWGFQPQYRDHYVLSYYDEMDLDLGQPTSVAYTTKCVDNKCVYVRFFERGVVVLNVTGSSVTISDADIHFNPYEGPYYFFEGGQDPDWNTGEMFTAATLNGSKSSDGRKYIGDALILVNTPQKVVSDIIVDNYLNDTSPGSDPTAFIGNWTQDCGSGAWAMGCGSWLGQYRNAYSFSGTGENKAVFSPTIGVTGAYEVFEWHGTPSTGTAVATNVPVTIRVDGSKLYESTIDQTRNLSQWNSLGLYYFMEDSDVEITLTNKANGMVVADAVRLVFKSEDMDNMPPLNPSGLRLDEATENTLRLGWSAPGAASDGDTVMFYRVFRNTQPTGTSYRTSFTDYGLTENTTYQYEIIGYDDSGNPCSTPMTGAYTTTVDLNAPEITDIVVDGLTSLYVTFDEPVDETSAENVSNYQISRNLTGETVNVLAAVYDNTANNVVLTTNMHTPGKTYTLSVNNVRDLSAAGNLADTQSEYDVIPDPIQVTVAADDEYELYVNGTFLGSGNVWYTATRYTVDPIIGKNVVAIKGYDAGGVVCGLVAEIEFMGTKFVTNDTWKVSTVEETGWESIQHNDLNWENATSYGLHGTAEPWASSQNVANISTTDNVHWIWSSDWENDKTVYFRCTLQMSADNTPPAPPQGVYTVQ